jgi:hypothetical protein
MREAASARVRSNLRERVTTDCSQEDVDADGSIGQAVTMNRELRAVVVGNGSHQGQIERQMSIRSFASSMRGGGLLSATKTKSKP